MGSEVYRAEVGVAHFGLRIEGSGLAFTRSEGASGLLPRAICLQKGEEAQRSHSPNSVILAISSDAGHHARNPDRYSAASPLSTKHSHLN